MQSCLSTAASGERQVDIEVMGALGDVFLDSFTESESRFVALRHTALVAVEQGLRPCAIKIQPKDHAAVALLHPRTSSIFVVSMRGVALEHTVPAGPGWVVSDLEDLGVAFDTRVPPP